MKRQALLGLLVSSLLVVGLLSQTSWATQEKAFYAGKTIVFIVPTKPGGGYDFYGRTVAKLMQNQLPGSTIIVKNVPGAGHIIGTNEIYHAKADGLTFGIFNPGVIAAQLAGQPGVNYDVEKMSWLGVTGIGPHVFVALPKYKDLEGVEKSSRILLATPGPGTAAHVAAALFIEMKTLKNIKLLTGYRGNSAEMAMMRGEVDAQFGSWSSLESFVKQGNAVPVMFIGLRPKEYPNVPLLEQVITAAKYKPVCSFVDSLASLLLRSFAGPPGIPPDRLQVLRQAFANALHSPQFIAMMQKADAPAGYLEPEKVEAMVKEIMRMPPDLVRMIKVAYGIKK